MNEKDYDFRNDTGTYQTGRTQPPKHYRGVLAFLIALVILLSGISTALSILNFKLYWKLNTQQASAPVAFSRSNEIPQPTEADHQEVQVLRAHLGITGTVIPNVHQRYYKLPSGIYVSQVAGRSEAQEKGIVVGDIITALNGTPIQVDSDLESWAQQLSQGDSVELTLYRSGAELSLTLTWSEYQ